MTCNVNVPKLKNTNDINDIEDIIKTEPGKYMNINFTDLFTNLIDYVKKKENDYYHKNKDYTYQNLIALMKRNYSTRPVLFLKYSVLFEIRFTNTSNSINYTNNEK